MRARAVNVLLSLVLSTITVVVAVSTFSGGSEMRSVGATEAASVRGGQVTCFDNSKCAAGTNCVDVCADDTIHKCQKNGHINYNPTADVNGNTVVNTYCTEEKCVYAAVTTTSCVSNPP